MSNVELQRQAYNQYFDQYEESVNSVHARFKPYSIDAWLPDCAGKRVLDLGCGNAYVLRELLAKGVPFARYTGVDIADEMLANNRRVHAGVPNAEFVVDDANTLANVPDGAYDIVISYGCLHHLDVPENAIRAVYAKLAPGGRFVAIEQNRHHPSATFFGFWAGLVGLDQGKVLALKDAVKERVDARPETAVAEYLDHHPGHPGKRTPDEFRTALAETGFSRSEVSCLYLELLPYRVYALHLALFKLQVALSRALMRRPRLKDVGTIVMLDAVR